MNVKDAMASRHIVIISDGDPTPPTSAVIRQLAANKITVTAVLTAAHGNRLHAQNTMRNLANRTKGDSSNVTNPRRCREFIRKKRGRSRAPLIFEQAAPWSPEVELSERAGHRLAGYHSADQWNRSDEPQGKRAGRGPVDFPAALGAGQSAFGPLDLRPWSVGRLHLRCRSALGQDLA